MSRDLPPPWKGVAVLLCVLLAGVSLPAAGWADRGASPSRSDPASDAGAEKESLSARMAGVVLASTVTTSETSAGAPPVTPPDRAHIWWVGLVPALEGCNPAEAFLEGALTRLAEELPEIELLLFLPASIPRSDPLFERIPRARTVTIPDEEYQRMSKAWPLPRLAILAQDHTPLFEASIPMAWVDPTQLVSQLAAFRRWATRSDR
ncbi:MAG: hypothetical protein BWX64_02253 [Acidobacteria bacterium ADurb.Bin051]|nr:MAG: hypothetical protein BWX64_02253 [Acidobacteria bacterium ADurb.Bin051]